MAARTYWAGFDSGGVLVAWKRRGGLVIVLEHSSRGKRELFTQVVIKSVGNYCCPCALEGFILHEVSSHEYSTSNQFSHRLSPIPYASNAICVRL